MFERLIESSPRSDSRARLSPGGSFSLAIHVVLVYGAIQATRDGGGDAAETSPVVIDMTWDDPEERKPGPPAIRMEDLRPRIVWPAPGDIPTTIPLVDSAFVLDSTMFRRNLIEERIWPGSSADSAGRSPLSESLVEERPELMDARAPEYPPLLQQAGIEGIVVVEVVIDTAGHAEPNSIRIVRSSHRAFEPAAQEAVLQSRYRPGRIGGRPVRTLVNVPISFSIQH